MVGEIIEITLIMWLIALASFAPLGYFIYIYTVKQGEPFGETEPHGDSPSAIADLVDKAIALFNTRKK
jgi:hypothetical protein